MPALDEKIGFGSECEVFDVGKGRCYKKYFYGDIDIIYENAKRAFEAGIGPKVYGRDDEGYYTEIVETFGY
ncbi:unnamed protein product [marine sediment metagenome]|uniref:Uncharacterized protein n=1 Tax=marine sediment metagenome TaxID=412755 RepID=X1NVG7_9ZZZZ